MFCPKCGSADQQPESYCRSCGEFIADYSANSFVLGKILGGSAPSTQIDVNLAVNLLTVFACFLLIGFLNGHYDALRERTGEAPPTVIYLVYAFLAVISVWQIYSLAVGVRLRTKLGRGKPDAAEPSSGRQSDSFGSIETKALPPHHEPVPRTAPLSVTEEPTKTLDRTLRK